MLKKMTAMLLALTMCAGVLAGCGDNSKNNDDSKTSSYEDKDTTGGEDEPAGSSLEGAEAALPVASLTIDGEKMDTENLVICTIDGVDISFDEFRFYYFYTLNNYERMYGVTKDALRADPVSYNQFLYAVVSTLQSEMVTDKLAEDYDIELDDEDREMIESNMQDARSGYESEEAFKEDMQRSYMTDEIYEKMFVRAQTYNKVMDTLFSNDGIFATSHEDFLKLMEDPDTYAHEVHIMIPFYSQAELDDSAAEGYDDMTLSQKIGAKGAAYTALDEDGRAEADKKAKAVAEEALKRALDGEDFNALVMEYGWDIGLEDPKDGYYMEVGNIGGYPQELLDATFSIDVDEIYGELIKNETYGYFIVKRLAPDMDYVNENIDAMISSHDQASIQEKFDEVAESMEVTYCDFWEKITIDSIT